MEFLKFQLVYLCTVLLTILIPIIWHYVMENINQNKPEEQ